MVELILEHAIQIGKANSLLELVTVDNQTSLARALCHPKVTKELVQRLIRKDGQMNQRQVLIAFDMLARRYQHPDASFEHLQPVLDQYKQQVIYQSLLYQLLHIIVRHNNIYLLKWLYENMKVRSNQEEIFSSSNVCFSGEVISNR